MEIVGLQWNLEWEDKAANFARAAELTAEAEPKPGALVVLPEMFATGFSMNVSGIGEEAAGESLAFLSSLARRHEVFVTGGIVTRRANGRGFNEAVTVDPEGREVGRYRKMHPFRYGGEGDSYDAGSAPALWRWHGLMVAPFICYDLRFPEIFRLGAAVGAECFVVIANWPAARIEHWRVLLKARAIENQAYVLGVNRCGADPKLNYPGSTLAVDPHGNVLGELGDRDGALKIEIDPEVVGTCRQKLPFLRDLRADLFRAGAIETGHGSGVEK